MRSGAIATYSIIVCLDRPSRSTSTSVEAGLNSPFLFPPPFFFLFCGGLFRFDVRTFVPKLLASSPSCAWMPRAKRPMDDSLAISWESDVGLRARGRENGALTVWPTPETVGIASRESCAMNAQVLKLTALWWVAWNPDVAKTIFIDDVRYQVTRFPLLDS